MSLAKLSSLVVILIAPALVVSADQGARTSAPRGAGAKPAAAASPAPVAAFWPQWRGPNRDGVSTETGLLTSWPAGGPRRVLVASGLGEGFAGVAVADGRILTMGDRRDGQYVIALEERTGREVWATRVGGRHQEEYSGPRATPTIDGALTYALSTDGDLVCLETATGRERWRKSLPREYRSPEPNWRYAESPLVDGDRVLVAPGAREAAIVALNKQNGQEIWRSAMPAFGRGGIDGPEYSSIVISNGGGVKQYVRLLGRGVIGVRASDGQFLWGYNRVANSTANISTPLIRDNFVFASTGYQAGGALLEIVPQGAGTATARERYFLEGRTFQNHHGGMVLVGDHIYAGTGHRMGIPICLEFATGRVAWGGNIRNAGQGSAALTAADGHVYLRYENGVMLLIEATPAGYREKGTFQIPNVVQPSWSHPVIAGGRLYLREQDALHVYDIRR
jgi:outer membrane protein assembly factor BamB